VRKRPNSSGDMKSSREIILYKPATRKLQGIMKRHQKIIDRQIAVAKKALIFILICQKAIPSLENFFPFFNEVDRQYVCSAIHAPATHVCTHVAKKRNHLSF